MRKKITGALLALMMVVTWGGLFSSISAYAPTAAASGKILKTNSGICHDPASPYYQRIKYASSYSSMAACLKSGGRVYVGYGGGSGTTSGNAKKTTKTKAKAKASQGYNRSQWSDGSWERVAGQCTIRNQLLKRYAKSGTLKVGAGCKVKSGKWKDLYSGSTITKVSQMEIDHIIPLHYAYEHGGKKWSAAKKRQFGNSAKGYKEGLYIPVSKSANASKGDKGPSKYLPVKAYVCKYVKKWRSIAKEYKIALAAVDKKVISATLKNKSNHC
jgi:hypothetical protein